MWLFDGKCCVMMLLFCSRSVVDTILRCKKKQQNPKQCSRNYPRAMVSTKTTCPTQHVGPNQIETRFNCCTVSPTIVPVCAIVIAVCVLRLFLALFLRYRIFCTHTLTLSVHNGYTSSILHVHRSINYATVAHFHLSLGKDEVLVCVFVVFFLIIPRSGTIGLHLSVQFNI